MEGPKESFNLEETYNSLTEIQHKVLETTLVNLKRAHMAIKEVNDYAESDEYKDVYNSLTDDQKFLFFYFTQKIGETVDESEEPLSQGLSEQEQ